MSHPEQRDFFMRMRQRFPEAFHGVSVMEIGSLNINGSVRDFFEADFYMGVDVIAGRGVDVVCPGQFVPAGCDAFDVVVSSECFEHNEAWVDTLWNMLRITRKWLFLTCASEGRPEHGTHDHHSGDSPATNGYYRNLTQADFLEAFNMDDLFIDYGFEYNPTSCDLYLWVCVR